MHRSVLAALPVVAALLIVTVLWAALRSEAAGDDAPLNDTMNDARDDPSDDAFCLQ